MLAHLHWPQWASQHLLQPRKQRATLQLRATQRIQQVLLGPASQHLERSNLQATDNGRVHKDGKHPPLAAAIPH
jgi:hypothetical protein